MLKHLYMKKTLFTLAALVLGALSMAGQTLSCEQYCGKARFAEANKNVDFKPLAVLMGDSITEGWASKDPDFFTEHKLVGRGISGQTTSQMLLRFRDDVVALQPKYVVILAGVNDIALNEGYSSLDGTVGNIISMCEIALANGIKPILCTPTPANVIPWRAEVTGTADKVDQLKYMIRSYAAAKQIQVVDYWGALHDEYRGFPQKWAYDGIHPNLDGYKVMEELLLKKLK